MSEKSVFPSKNRYPESLVIAAATCRTGPSNLPPAAQWMKPAKKSGRIAPDSATTASRSVRRKSRTAGGSISSSGSAAVLTNGSSQR